MGSATTTTTPQNEVEALMKQVADENGLGMISQKKSRITIFGHKHKIKNFIQKFNIFHKKISTTFDFGLFLKSNCLF